MLRKLYDWVLNLAGSRHAPKTLAAVSFAESSFFPIPPDVMLAPMVLARPERAFLYATICTVASVVGGLAGYAIGHFLEPVGYSILAFFGHPEGPAEFQKWFDKWGALIILVKGLTPIPYKLVTITAGLAHFDLTVFIWTSIVTRGARFFLTATLLKYFGPSIRAEVERRLGLYSMIAVVLVLGVILVLKVL